MARRPDDQNPHCRSSLGMIRTDYAAPTQDPASGVFPGVANRPAIDS
ncbi:hypothetical protein RHECNPAF_1470014 [Rhizobium etli CNPAF512]|nr:hypothetical protein RHECNPAF_1470014 [Rhizobium etli CNPAF512]